MPDDRARHELYRALANLLGTRRADTLMTLLPPVGWADVATKDDLQRFGAALGMRIDTGFHRQDARLAQLEAGIEARFAHAGARTDARFAVVDSRFENADARFAQLDARLSQIEGHVDRSLREQTRTLILGLVGAMVTVASLCLGTVALAG